MAQTLEQINTVRVRMGQEPLAELPSSEQQSQNHEETSTVTGEETPPKKDTPPATPVELNDDVVLEYLKAKGFQGQSFEDLNKPITEADIAAQAEKRENDKLSYGLNKGLFNRKTYENFISDSKNNNDLVYADYHSAAKREDPNLSDEDIQTEFAAKFGLDAEPGTRRYKRGQQEINLLAKEIIKEKYPKIVSLDSEYDQFESTQNSQQAIQRKILQSTPAYQKDLNEVFAELKKIPTKFSDGKEYAVELLEDSIADIKRDLSNPEFVAQQIQSGWTKEQLKNVAFTAILSKNFPVIVEEIVKQAMLDSQKGLRGIPTSTQKNKEVVTENKILSDKQQMALESIMPGYKTQAAN